MHIGILQTGHAPDAIIGETGDYSDLFKTLFKDEDFTYSTWNVVDGEFPPDAGAAEGWIITGSRHGAYEDHDWIPPLEDLIREIARRETPMIGVCFGHQIIAQAMGGKVEKFKGGWSVGRQSYDFGDTILNLNAWHQDQVVELPPNAQVIASSPFCANAALVIGTSILTVQPHPEFQSDFIEGLINHRSDAVPDDRVDAARAALDKPNDNAAMAARMAGFLRKGAK